MNGDRPLTGVRILSLAEQYPGPYATLILSDLGADVIQVERPASGDPARRYPEFHESVNRGRRSVALDLKDPRAVEAVIRIAATADALIEGFRPGVMERLGLGQEALRAANPELVVVSISGFGQDGPYRNRPAHDLTYQALTGHLAGSDHPEDETVGLSLADLASGMFGAIAVLTGLAARRAGRPGSTFDVSMFDSMISLLTTTLGPLLNGATTALELGRDPAYGLFPTSDGRLISLSISFEDKFWDALCAAVGMPHHIGVEAEERLRRRAELRADLGAVLASASLDEWDERLSGSEVPYGRVSRLEELEEDPHVRSRGLVQEVDGRRFVRQPIVVDGRRLGPRSPVPALGAHTSEVLTQAGVDPAIVTELNGSQSSSSRPGTFGVTTR